MAKYANIGSLRSARTAKPPIGLGMVRQILAGLVPEFLFDPQRHAAQARGSRRPEMGSGERRRMRKRDRRRRRNGGGRD